MKKTYVIIGVTAVIAVSFALVSPILISGLKGEEKKPGQTISVKTPRGIQALSASAFGKLDFVANSNVPKGMGGDEAAAPAASGGGVAQDAAQSAAKAMIGRPSDIIAPEFFNFKFVYKGEELKLEQPQMEVYRRIKGDGQFASGLTELIGGVNLDLVNLGAFSNLKMQNLSLAEDKDLGLSLYLDFNEDTVSINENWQKWYQPAADVAIGKVMPVDGGVKIEDVPADGELVATADRFMSEKGINRDNYGQGRLEDYWRRDYERAPDKTNYYIPEVMTVVYPLLVNGQEVRDQSGNFHGLRVSVNIKRQLASGLYGLSPYRYESSSYETETDSARILKLAENGGYNRTYFAEQAETREVEIGTPVSAYIATWNYADNKNDELLVPALIFPVKKEPAEATYFYQRYVVLPLAKDMLSKLENQPTDGPVLMKSGAASGGSGTVGAESIAVPPIKPLQ